MTLYTRQFWYGVLCALLVQWGAPYAKRYAPRAKIFNGRELIAYFHDFSGHSFTERLPENHMIKQVVSFFAAFNSGNSTS